VTSAPKPSLIGKHGALFALILLCLMATARYDAFATPENILNVLRQNSMVGIIAIGMTFVIMSGGVDLSVGALLAVGGVLAGALAPYGSGVAIAGAIGVTAALGATSGVLIARARIQPFITTLAVLIAARGVILIATEEQSVRVDRDAAFLTWLGRGYLGPIPVPVVIFAVVVFLGWVLLNHTRFGRHVYAIGDNEEAARLMGLDVGRVTVGVYALSGALAGLAGVLLAARLGTGQPVAGEGRELDAIAAVVVGGTLLVGGRGTITGTVFGVLIFATLTNVFVQTNLTSSVQAVAKGIIIVIAVLLQQRFAKPTGRST
jgi:ribose/xylose/arabinose/galactoside ABC-type transport system permease subunit